MIRYRIVYSATKQPVSNKVFSSPQDALTLVKEIKLITGIVEPMRIESFVKNIGQGRLLVTNRGVYSITMDNESKTRHRYSHSFPLAGLAWRKREIQRKSNSRAPWITKDWYRKSNVSAIHFPHICPFDTQFVRYTKSEEDGIKGIYTTTTVNRYMGRYFYNVDRENRLEAARVFYTLSHNKLYFGETPDEIEQVYRDGPSSCMSYCNSRYNGRGHPVRAYGAGDIKIAYVVDKNNIPVARTLVYNRKFTVIYNSTHPGGQALLYHLRVNGYVSDADALVGAKMLHIENVHGFDLPYMDHDIGVTIERCMHEDRSYLSVRTGSDANWFGTEEGIAYRKE